jgi:parvulin-like peptidyl-prolyl isomerase
MKYVDGRWNRIATLVFFPWALFMAAVAGCTNESHETSVKKEAVAGPPAVAATVNGVAITRADFERTLQHAEKTYLLQDGRIGDADKTRLSSRILEKMIQDELLVQHARTEGIRVTPEEVEARLERIKEEGGGEEAYRFFLGERGLDPKQVRFYIERNMVIERLTEKMRATEHIQEQEIAAYLDKHEGEFRSPDSVDLAHLLLARREDRPDPMQRARSVREEIRKGMTFEKAVAKYSDDDATREQDGRLGTMQKGDMLPVLEKAAFSLPKGEVSGPVESPAGVHLLKVLDKQPGKRESATKVRQQVAERLLEERLETRLAELAQRLQKDAVVVISP